MSEWNDFFVAVAGAAAALAGLLFVGISINLGEVLALRTLPLKASIALILLFCILASSLVLLSPIDDTVIYGAIVACIGVAAWVIITRADVIIYKTIQKPYQRRQLINVVLDQLAVLPYIACGLHLFFSGEHGIYWILPAVMVSFGKAIFDAWILLIEIKR